MRSGGVLLVNAGLGRATAPPSTQPTQVWAWDGVQWRVLDSAGPPIRSLAGVAYDQRPRRAGAARRLVHRCRSRYGDTWEWRADAGWRRIDVPGPGILDHTRMSYDPSRQEAVLFGGQHGRRHLPRGGLDLRRRPVDGAARRRARRAAFTTPCSTTRGLGGVVVFGGFEPGASDRGDTWLWNGQTWAESPPAPAPRRTPGWPYDEGRGALVLVGGGESRRAARAPRCAGWVPLGLSGTPPPRYLPGVAYDRSRRVLVVFGGGNPTAARCSTTPGSSEPRRGGGTVTRPP